MIWTPSQPINEFHWSAIQNQISPGELLCQPPSARLWASCQSRQNSGGLPCRKSECFEGMFPFTFLTRRLKLYNHHSHQPIKSDMGHILEYRIGNSCNDCMIVDGIININTWTHPIAIFNENWNLSGFDLLVHKNTNRCEALCSVYVLIEDWFQK